MNIDRERVSGIIESVQLTQYSRDVPYRNDNRWDPGTLGDGSASALIARYLSPTDKILDLGCGRGHILLEINSSFQYGLGIDNDPEQINLSNDAKREQEVHNVDFLLLDFLKESDRLEPGSFDMLISIRGALYDTDVCIQAARRLLRPDGLLFAEEIGELHHKEAVEIFDDPAKVTEAESVLNRYRNLLEKNGFEVRLAADIMGKMMFPDIYAWLAYDSSIRSWLGIQPHDPDDPRIAFFAERNTIQTGEVGMTWHCPWIGCVKK